MSSDSPPSKRKRPQRACVATATQKKQLNEELYINAMLEEVYELLSDSPHTHDENVVHALLQSISKYLDTHQSVITAQNVPCVESSHVEHNDPEDDPDNEVDIDDEDSWSDELSEHSSDRDFIAASDDEGSYVPSEEEGEYVDSTNSDE